VYSPLGFVPTGEKFLSETIDPEFKLTYVRMPINIAFDEVHECLPENYVVCNPGHGDSHFSAEHLLSLNLRKHPQVVVVDFCELPKQLNTTLVFFPLVISLFKLKGGQQASDRIQSQVTLMKEYMRTSSISNGHEVVRVDLWAQYMNENGITLFMHGNSGSMEGIREQFKQDLYPSHSRHIIIPYGHLNNELLYPDIKLLSLFRNRPFLVFYFGGARGGEAGAVRKQVHDGIEHLQSQHVNVSVHSITGTNLLEH
jgi:hypothetical protein